MLRKNTFQSYQGPYILLYYYSILGVPCLGFPLQSLYFTPSASTRDKENTLCFAQVQRSLHSLCQWSKVVGQVAEVLTWLLALLLLDCLHEASVPPFVVHEPYLHRACALATAEEVRISREGTVVACVRQLWFAGQRGISSVF